MQRGPGWSGVILVTPITSLVVVFGERLATERGLLPSAAATDSAPEPPKVTTATVPGLEGMSLGAATELLQARGLTVLVRDKREHPTAPPDRVIAQDPLPGSVLPSQAPVSVTLSSGKPPGVPAPELNGLSFDAAVRALEAAGLKVGAISGPQSGDRRVEHSDAATGTTLAPGTAVALTLVAEVAVPKLVGLSWQGPSA